MMFTQVYFQHTRRAYDHHATEALRRCLEKVQAGATAPSTFPPPEGDANLRAYLEWDDWRVYGMLAAGEGGEDGAVLRTREHDRSVFQTVEVPEPPDVDRFEEVCAALGELLSFRDHAEKSWYKLADEDVPIERRIGDRTIVTPLSVLSSVVRGLTPVRQLRAYVRARDRDRGREIAAKFA
jgi:uncharacterized protein